MVMLHLAGSAMISLQTTKEQLVENEGDVIYNVIFKWCCFSQIVNSRTMGWTQILI